MSRLEQITPEEMPEVVRIASRIRDEEQAKADEEQGRQAFVAAAAEVDLPREYLERAAEQLQQSRTLGVRRRSRTRAITLIVLSAVVALAGIWHLTHLPPPAPILYTFSASQWELNTNAETQADVTFQDLDGRKSAAIIHVDRFAPRADGQYFVNLDAPPAVNSLSGYKTTSFFVKSGGINNIRLYLEAGPTERWRSPNVQGTSQWQEQTIDLSQYEHQVRASSSSPWRSEGAGQQPAHIDTLSFKVGTYMNDVSSSGDIAVDDLEIR